MYVLSIEERLILSALNLDALATAEEIAERTKIHAMKIRRLRRRMEEAQIFSIWPVINNFKLGFVDYGILFSIRYISKSLEQKFVNSLVKSEYVRYLAEVGGRYKYHLVICARDLVDLNNVLDTLSETYQGIIQEKSIAVCTLLVEISTPLTDRNININKMIYWQATKERKKIDEIEHRMLKSIARMPFRSQAEHARSLGISAMTFSYRLEKLKQEKILVGYKLNLNTEKIGYIHFVMLVSLKNLGHAGRKKIINFALQHPNITALCENLGEWDYELYVWVKNLQEISKISSALEEIAPDVISRMEATPILSILKLSAYPFERYASVKS